MILSVIAATVLGATGLHMIFSGKYASTRKTSWIPFSMAVMELALCGALDLAAYPVLTAILMICRVTVLFCCYRVMKIDAAMERTRQRRRAVWKHIATTAPEACLISGNVETRSRRRTVA